MTELVTSADEHTKAFRAQFLYLRKYIDANDLEGHHVVQDLKSYMLLRFSAREEHREVLCAPAPAQGRPLPSPLCPGGRTASVPPPLPGAPRWLCLRPQEVIKRVSQKLGMPYYLRPQATRSVSPGAHTRADPGGRLTRVRPPPRRRAGTSSRPRSARACSTSCTGR